MNFAGRFNLKPSLGAIGKNKMEEIQEEIFQIRKIAKIENVSMSFVLNVKILLEKKKQNELFKRANVIIEGSDIPSALEVIAINTGKYGF